MSTGGTGGKWEEKREDILITIHRTLDCQTLCVMEQTRRDSGLNVTPKQRAFVQYYIETGGNAPEAAMRAHNCSSRASSSVSHLQIVGDHEEVIFFERQPVRF